jgi:hypothetical protein
MNNKIVLGMCLTSRHDFGLMSEADAQFLYKEMYQLYEHNVKPVIEKLESELDEMTDQIEALQRELRCERDKVQTYQNNGHFY